MIPEVKKIIEDNFTEFKEFRVNNQKLGFLKLLKEFTGLGLGELKLIVDEIWVLDFNSSTSIPHNCPNFENIYSLVSLRREKLEIIKRKILIQECIKTIRNKKDDELVPILTNLTSEDLERILMLFL